MTVKGHGELSEVPTRIFSCDKALVEGFEKELGYFSVAEIQQARGPLGLQVERDLYFSPTPLSELQPELDRGR